MKGSTNVGKKFVSIILAALFGFAALAAGPAPVTADEGDEPSGYDAHDRAAMLAFLETEDEDGVKNGEKLSADYDPLDPSTWAGIVWTEDEEKRLKFFTAAYSELCGVLDLNGASALERVTVTGNALTGLDLADCTSLKYLVCGSNSISEIRLENCVGLKYLYCFGNELTGLSLSSCAELDTLNCSGNRIPSLNMTSFPDLLVLDCAGNGMTSLTVSGAPDLYYLNCADNALTELTVQDSAGLNTFDCSNNLLTELDLSGCPSVMTFDFRGNRFRHLDMSACANVTLDRLYAGEGGYVGAASDDGCWTFIIEAVPEEGYGFDCWRNYSTGAFLTQSPSVRLYPDSFQWYETELLACFEELPEPVPVPGDADGDGVADIYDSLLVLRYSMGLGELSEDALGRCDMDGSGGIDVYDALLILRAAMGLGE